MAKVVAAQNPYAAKDGVVNSPLEYQMPNNSMAFAAPSASEENGYVDSPIGAHAPGLRTEVGQTPDPMRVRLMPARDFRPDPAQPADAWYRRLDADDAHRHSVEDQRTDGFTVRREGSGKPTAEDPRRRPVAESRLTALLSPRTYLFTRPLWGGPHRQNGEHFSMADHRRDYPILGMAPVRQGRNTFRISPAPWDTDMVDVPQDNGIQDVSSARIQAVEVPTQNRWRLS